MADKWKKSKTKKWYSAVLRANTVDRVPRKFSKKRSATIKALWKTDSYRAKASKGRSNRIKKSWADPVSRKNRMKGAKKASIKRKAWWKRNYFKMCKIRKQQAKKYHWKVTKALKKRWQDPDYKKKMCKIRRKQSHGNQLRHPKASWYRTKYTGKCGSRWMRSSWEVAFARWLDFCGVKWEYESKRFFLSKGRYYTPDFYLPDQDTHVELKGWFTKQDKKKIEKFQKMYPDVKYYLFFGKHLAKVLEFRKAA